MEKPKIVPFLASSFSPHTFLLVAPPVCICLETFSNMMLAKIYILSDYEYVFYSFVFRRALIDEPLEDPLDWGGGCVKMSATLVG